MFKSLSDGFRKARQKLSGVGELTEDVIDGALREVRLSLLEADVELNVTRRFLAKAREKMLGQRASPEAERQRDDEAQVVPVVVVTNIRMRLLTQIGELIM